MTTPLPTDSPKIFISYAWENQATAKQLQQALQAAGAEVFVDYTGIQGGESLPTRISQALRWCDTLILLWSEHAADSHWVELEWTSALALKRHLIPCKLDKTALPEILWGKRYLEFKEFDHGLNELLAALRLKTPATIVSEPTQKLFSQFPLPRLRSQAQNDIINEDVAAMLKHYDFFCAEHELSKWWCNPNGNGIKHKYELQHNGKIIVDNAAGLVWQQSGSPDAMIFSDVKMYIDDLNSQRFADYNNWRLPTLEEAMSLMEREKKNNYLHIDNMFDKNQSWIWAADTFTTGVAWIVSFLYGICYHYPITYIGFVRVARSGQSI